LDDRPWRIVAGPVISANTYHCAAIPIDPDTAKRTAAANDWGRIRQEIAWSKCAHGHELNIKASSPVAAHNSCLAEIPDDLSDSQILTPSAGELMTRRPHLCPMCQRPFPPRLVVHGPVRQRIVDLIANRPDGITRGEILDLVYADDPNGGPANPNTVSVLIMRANEELAAQGFRILPAWRGRGARYQLVRVAP
jgi:hypothetical protein